MDFWGCTSLCGCFLEGNSKVMGRWAREGQTAATLV